MQSRASLSARTAPSMRRFVLAFILVFILALATFSVSPGWAASPIVRDGGTLELADATYRLDGIDAPAFDQICIDDHADSWTCGVEARDQLVRLIGGRQGPFWGWGAGRPPKKQAGRRCRRRG